MKKTLIKLILILALVPMLVQGQTYTNQATTTSLGGSQSEAGNLSSFVVVGGSSVVGISTGGNNEARHGFIFANTDELFLLPPADLSVRVVSETEMTLSWAESPFGADNYEIERSTDGINFSTAGTVSVGNSTFNDTGLTANTLYFYKVKATNLAGGESPSTAQVANATFSGTLDDKWSWLNSGEGESYGRFVDTDPDGNVYVSGQFSGTLDINGTAINALGTRDGFISKFDGSGNLIWINQIGGAGDYASGEEIIIDDLGSIYMTGNFQGTVNYGGTNLTSQGANDAFLLKIDTNGNLIWSRSAGNVNNDFGRDLVFTNTGDVVWMWYQNGINVGTYLTKFDISGNTIWERRIADQDQSLGNSMSIDPAGNLYCAGSFDLATDFGGVFLSPNSARDAFLLKTDPSGNVEWVKQSSGAEAATYGVTATDEAVFISGFFDDASLSWDGVNLTHYGDRDIFIVKYDYAGNILWARSAGGAFSDGSLTIADDGDGGVFAGGFLGGGTETFEGDNVENGFMFLANYDRQGQLVWVDKAEGDINSTTTVRDISTDGENIFSTGRTGGNARFGTIAVSSSANNQMFVGSYQARIVCDIPTNLTANSITTDGVTMTWDELDINDVYDLRYRLKGNSGWTEQIGLTEPTSTLSGLQSGMTYQVQVRKDCGSGTVSDWSDQTEFDTEGAPTCPTPTDLTATVAGQDVTLGWSDAGADSYVVRYRLKGTSTWSLIAPDPTTNTANLTSLESGATYQFRVKSVCNSIESPFSDVAEFTTEGPPVCEIPSGFTVTAIGDNTATISWTDPASGPDSYDVKYGVLGGAGTIVENTTANSIVLSGLLPGTTYRYFVRSVCSTDGSLVSVYSEREEFTTTGDPACDIPEGVAFSNIGDNSVTVSWNTVATALTYDVRYRISGNAGGWQLIEGISGTTVDINSLFSGSVYQVSVRSVCSFDGSVRSQYSDIADFTTTGVPACEIPSVFNVTEESNPGDVTIDWTASSGALKYEIRYKVQGTSGWTYVETADSNPTILLSGLAAGVTYVYSVRTICTLDGSLVSAYSDSEQFVLSDGTTTCDVPSNVSTSSLGENDATLTWDAVGSALTYDFRYRVKGSTTWINQSTSTTDAVLSGLNAGTEYQFRVRSVCDAGGSIASSYTSTFVFITSGTSDCITPSGITVSSITDNGAFVDWSDASGALEYEVRYKIQGASGWNIEYVTTSSISLAGSLLSGMPYQVKVRSICAADRSFLSPFSSSVVFTTTGTPACEVPTGLAANNEFTTSVDLSWDDANGAISYEIWYRILGDATWSIETSTDNLISLTGLTPDEEYQWRVRTICASDNTVRSKFSNLSSFTTTTPGTRFARTSGGTANSNFGGLSEASLEAYPNPFNSQLNVEYFHPKEGFISIKVYSTTGTEVGTIFEGHEISGTRSYQFLGDDLKPGAYFIRAIDFDGEVQQQRVILQR